MNATALIGSLVDLAKIVAPLGGPVAVKTIEVLDRTVTAFKDHMSIEDEDKLLATREQLEEQVNAHVDATVKALRGD